MQEYIYVVISRTPTRFGRAIRKVTNQQYNHASIALDANLDHTYAFARKRHKAPLLGGLVRENVDRFTLRSKEPVPVMIFRIPVTVEQKRNISNIINEMINNRKYVYNLFSVLTYPIFKGFSVKNAFSCIEFVSYILQYLGYLTDLPACKYKPDDLITELGDFIWQTTDVRDVMTYNANAEAYFAPFRMRFIANSIGYVCLIIKHGFSLFPNIANLNTFHIEY
jgi:hypothetical protein